MNLDKLFVSEFKELISCKLSKLSIGTRSLQSIPIPDLSMFAQAGCTLRGGRQVYVHGIEEGNYAMLNNKMFNYIPKPNLKKRKFDRNGWITDANGNFVYENVPLPRGSIAIITDIKLGVKVGYRVNEGFDFIDSQTNNAGVTLYKHIIPKKYCYEVNRCALTLSATMPRLRYMCHKIVLTNGMTVYLSVVPYKPNVEVSYRILSLRASTHFEPVVQYIEKAWVKDNIAFDPNMTVVNPTTTGVENVAWSNLGSTIESEFMRFNPEKSLADTGNDFDISGYI